MNFRKLQWIEFGVTTCFWPIYWAFKLKSQAPVSFGLYLLQRVSVLLPDFSRFFTIRPELTLLHTWICKRFFFDFQIRVGWTGTEPNPKIRFFLVCVWFRSHLPNPNMKIEKNGHRSLVTCKWLYMGVKHKDYDHERFWLKPRNAKVRKLGLGLSNSIFSLSTNIVNNTYDFLI